MKATNAMFVVYMTGGVDAASGKSWCPDCDDARPMIQKALLEKCKLPIIKGTVMERDSWVGVADHPYKAHPVLKAGGVPSLMLCQGQQVLMRADDEEHFKNEEFITSFNGEDN